jgi:hypothetical protein
MDSRICPNPMTRGALLAAAIFLLGAPISASSEQRARLLPKLHAGQTFTYLIHYQADKDVKTESRVAVALAPAASQIDAHALLRIRILDLQQVGGGLSIHAQGQFLVRDMGATAANPGAQGRDSESLPTEPREKSIEFTILPDGSTEKVRGQDALSPEQQQIWQEWVARFATAWTLSEQGARVGDKWKSEQSEQAPSPIAALAWVRDSIYVRNEPCHASRMSLTGDFSPASGPSDTCAVLLASAKLTQKSSPKDTTPPDFKLRELKTMGTAKGTNEIITYISLTTGLVVRATEEAKQQMDVVIAKADGTNRVHYTLDATSHSEILLVTETPLTHP